MRAKTILSKIEAGYRVTYTVRRLRGYLWGYASLVFMPADAKIGLLNIQHRLDCFRHDEAPYDKPRWEVVPSLLREAAAEALKLAKIQKGDRNE